MPVVPTTSFGEIVADVLATLDASAVTIADWLDVSNDPAYPTPWVEYKIRTATADVGEMILGIDGHPLRSFFMTLEGPFVDAVQLPSFTGSPGDCFVSRSTGADFLFAYPREVQNVRTMRARPELWRDDFFAVSPTNHIFFTGEASSLAKIYLGVFDPSDPGFYDDFPDSLKNAVANRALALLFPQGGNNLGAAGYFDRVWMETVQLLITRNARVPAARPYAETVR